VKFGPKKYILVARAFIQHPDELASGYVLVVPPGRKTKNHRKNTEWFHQTFGINVVLNSFAEGRPSTGSRML
jgi:hypothetical protein